MKQLLLLLALVCVSCATHHPDLVDFYQIHGRTSITLARAAYSPEYPGSPQYGQWSHGNFLHVIDHQNHKLISYEWGKDVPSASITLVPDSFATSTRSRRMLAILDARWLAADSILLAVNPLYFNVGERMDGFLMLIDSTGRVLDQLNLKGYPGPTFDNPGFSRFGSMFPSFNGNETVDRNRKTWILPLRRWLNTAPGDSLFEQDGLNIAGYVSWIDRESGFQLLRAKAPAVSGNGYYPGSFGYPQSVITHDNRYLFSFGYTAQCVLTSPEDTQSIAVAIPSTLFDHVPFTRKPVEDLPNSVYPKSFVSDDLGLPKYGKMYFDPYRRRYYRIVRQPMNGPAAYTVLIADTTFRVIGEGLLPEELSPVHGGFSVFFTPDGIYFWNPTKTSAYANRYVFTRLDFQPTRKPAARELRKALAARAQATKPAGTGLPDYLSQQHKLAPKDDALLIVPVDNSCPSCKDYVLKYFADSVFASGTAGPRLLLAAANPSEIDIALHRHGLEPYRDRILTDPKRQFLRYAEDWINPRWLVFKDGALTEDVILNPDQIPTLPDRVRRWRAGS